MKLEMRVYGLDWPTFPSETYLDVPFVPRVGEYIVTGQGILEVLKIVYNYQPHDRVVSVYV
jgi:hypothetical protein